MTIITVICFIALIPTVVLSIDNYMKLKELDRSREEDNDLSKELETLRNNTVTIDDWNKLVCVVNESREQGIDNDILYELNRRMDATYGNHQRQIDCIYQRQSILAEQLKIKLPEMQRTELSQVNKTKPNEVTKDTSFEDVVAVVQKVMNKEAQKVEFSSEENL